MCILIKKQCLSSSINTTEKKIAFNVHVKDIILSQSVGEYIHYLSLRWEELTTQGFSFTKRQHYKKCIHAFNGKTGKTYHYYTWRSILSFTYIWTDVYQSSSGVKFIDWVHQTNLFPVSMHGTSYSAVCVRIYHDLVSIMHYRNNVFSC